MIRRKIPKVGDFVEVRTPSDGWMNGVCEKVSSDYVAIKLDKPRKMTHSESEMQKYMRTEPNLLSWSIYKSQCALDIRIKENADE